MPLSHHDLCIPGTGGRLPAQGLGASRPDLPPVMHATDRLAAAIDQLDAAVSRLISRIGPVLMDVPPAAGGAPPMPPTAGSCQIARIVNDQADRIAQIAAMAHAAHDRCEL